MSKEKLTVFQRLSNVLSPYNTKDSYKIPKQRYNIPNGEILRTTNKVEHDRELLQAQQNKYLSGMWKKVENGLYQQSINYETTRISSYADYEAMEYYPTIAAAIDCVMEEATTINAKGKMLNIYSDSNRVKGILEDLFFNKLDLHTSLPMWTRNLVKYGDNFCFLILDDKRGVIGAKQLPNYEMERREGELYEMLTKKEYGENGNQTKFYWRGRDIEFNSWQIAHFRLLTDDRKLPYGSSFLEKVRRIWKLLVLSEDAMLVYRITRAPERRVFKIYTGNIDDKDVPQYVEDIANKFKRQPIVDPQTGQIDLRYNQLSQDQDFFIPVRSEDAPTPIDTLPGAGNLDQISDIQYLRENLFTALRVPKPFLGFEETTGDGKNLALQDIRFTRTINRVQQSVLQELNKIAIIHLYLLGFDEDLDNFSLTLNNPSRQAEMLEIEYLQQKITLFRDAVSPSDNGLASMSWTRAQREIMGRSDDEIKDDLLEQRMERAASAELERTPEIITHTGMFDKVDRVYGDINKALNSDGGKSESSGDSNSSSGGGLGGSFGGGGVSGEDLDFDDENLDSEELDDTENETEETDENLDSESEVEVGSLEENVKHNDIINILNERINKSKKIDNLLNEKDEKTSNGTLRVISKIDKLLK